MPRRISHKPLSIQQQSGSLTVMAVFVIVVLGLLGLSLVDQLRSSSQNVIYEVLGARATLAAQTGLELLAAQSFPVGGTDQLCLNTGGVNVDVGNISGLNDCEFTIRCNTQTITENGADTLRYYQFQSIGTCTTGKEWTSRTLSREAVVRL